MLYNGTTTSEFHTHRESTSSMDFQIDKTMKSDNITIHDKEHDAEFLEQLDNNLMQEEQAHTDYLD